jgi:hypothetical protein
VEKSSPAVYQSPTGTNAGFIGIGTVSPGVQFDLEESSAANVQARVGNLSQMTNSVALVSAAASTASVQDDIIAVMKADGGIATGHVESGFFGTFSNHPVGFGVNNTTYMFMSNGGTTLGYVGVGTTSPTNILHVNGATPILSTGTGAGFEFQDRAGGTSPETEWYGKGNVSRLWRSDVSTNNGSGFLGDVMGLSNNGLPGVGTTSSPDNVLLALSGSFAVQGPSPWIDVTLYGADPSGASDSTSAINTAISKCPNPASSGAIGCTVFFPPGSYAVSGSGLSITQSGVKLLGSGAVEATASPSLPSAASEIVSNITSTSNFVLAVTGEGTANINGLVISDLGFREGTPGTLTTGAAILLRDVQYFSIDHVSCEGFKTSTCLELQGDTGTPNVYTQFGSIKDFFAQAKFGISTAQATQLGTSAAPYVSEVSMLGGNIECLAGGVISGSVGVNLDGTSGQNGEIQIFGAAVNDCETGYALKNTGATHLVGKAECDSTNFGCITGLLMDNPSSTRLTNGNVITMQASKMSTSTHAGVGIQINASNSSTPPVRNQIVGASFLSNDSDICMNSNSLSSTMVLVAATPDTHGCTTGALVTGSQFPTAAPTGTAAGTGVAIVGGGNVLSWSAGGSAPSGNCVTGSLYSNNSGSPGTLYVCTAANTWAKVI